MRRIRRRRQRTDWTEQHFHQLVCSHDFFGDAFGTLTDLDDAALAEAVSAMAQCWADREEQVREIAGPNRQPWFAAFAEDPDRLVAETLAYREHMKIYPHGSKCDCADCLDREPTRCPPACRACFPPTAA